MYKSCLLIDPAKKTISKALLVNGMESIHKLVGVPRIKSRPLNDQGDHLFFESDAHSGGRYSDAGFQIDDSPVIRGYAVITRLASERDLEDPAVNHSELNERLTFVS
jgi:hypothetical protein